MLIGEFARQTELSQDTIRFYVRKGLLSPETGRKGGRHPWQIFRRSDVAVARTIRFAQSLGLSLREIAGVMDVLRSGAPDREVAVLDDQIARLSQKVAELAKLANYLQAKRDWISHGKTTDKPSLSSLLRRL
jgi:MerR family transcriptional regulator, copper efflux regulator